MPSSHASESAPAATSITFCPDTASRRFRLSYVKMDGYIRVSRVAGRQGESFISPKVQREQIEAYAKARGFTIDAWHEDLDISGGTLERPALERALARCRSDESGGIIAAKLDRLARSLSGLAQLVQTAQDEGPGPRPGHPPPRPPKP